MIKDNNSIIILANGEFPAHNVPLTKLRASGQIICCDGATAKLIAAGMQPSAIVGDMDSLSTEIQQKYSDIIFKSNCQESNDLTKAFHYALELKPSSITILGATGMREDHSLANISLLAQYSSLTDIPIELLTNYGKFKVVFTGGIFDCEPKQQISFFSLESNLKIKSKGLKYPLDNVVFDSWWKASLNECEENSYQLDLSMSAPLIIFSAY